jgi:hypothetical protein
MYIGSGFDALEVQVSDWMTELEDISHFYEYNAELAAAFYLGEPDEGESLRRAA